MAQINPLIAYVQEHDNSSLRDLTDKLREFAPEDKVTQLNYVQRISEWKNGHRNVPDWAEKAFRRLALKAWQEKMADNAPGAGVERFAEVAGCPELAEISEAISLLKTTPASKARDSALEALQRASTIVLGRSLS